MKRDLTAVVWTRLNVTPQKMGQLYLTEKECRFTYDTDYLATGLPGLGIIYDPAIIKDNTLVWSRSAFFDFLPPIQFLIPPRGAHNFQRQLVLNYLHKKGITPGSQWEADWEILKLAGHGAIGHLDVFESDDKAMEWYGTPVKHELFKLTDEIGFSLKSFLTWFDDDAGLLINAIGPTPSVGGAIPKLLLSMPAAGWNGEIGLPTRSPVDGVTDVVVKFEQSNHYPGLIELEALTLDIHEEAGFVVPRYWQSKVNDIPVLAVERFDRDANHTPIFYETLYSVMACGDRSVTTHFDYEYDKIVQAMERSPIDLVSDKKAAKTHVLKRLLLAILTGNGDMHMENLSLIRQDNRLAFSPVYDPTPMRAYSRHNILTAMPFGQYGLIVKGHDEPIKFEDALHRFAGVLKINRTQLEGMIEACLNETETYPDRVSALTSLPEDNKQQLIRTVQRERERFRKILTHKT